jgi:hypothetical protein
VGVADSMVAAAWTVGVLAEGTGKLATLAVAVK